MQTNYINRASESKDDLTDKEVRELIERNLNDPDVTDFTVTMNRHDRRIVIAENVLHLLAFSTRQLADIQSTRHPYNGRAASLAITHLEDAQYRVLDIIVNLRAEESPAIDEQQE